MSKALGLAALTLALAIRGQAAAGGQKPPPLPPPFPGKEVPSGGVAAAATEWKPGVLPPSTTPEAAAAWDTLCKASLAPGAERSAVQAFELVLGVRARNGTGGTNDLDAEFRFLQPGWVRVKTVKSIKEVGRGPGGDWFIDGARNEKKRISVGREYAEDRRQLDDWTAVARLFVSLTDPRSLRLAALEVLKSAPPAIPATLAKRAGELAWLRVRSPDFRLVGANPASSVFRGSLGWDPKTGLVELALVEEDAQDSELRASAKLVEMREPTASGGFRIPKKIFIYSIEEGRMPLAFAVPPGLDLFVTSSNLRAVLKPEDFELH
jgi:hypothetical protein